MADGRYVGVSIEGQVGVRESPTLAEFNDSFRSSSGARPGLIKNAFSSPRVLDEWGPEYLRERVGDRRVLVYVSADGRFPGGRGPYDDTKHRAVEMCVGECLDRIAGRALPPILTPGERCYLYQAPASVFGDLLEEVADPVYVPAPRRKDVLRNLWVSGDGNVTPAHLDYVENILVQVSGTKRVLLWSPEHYEHLYIRPLGQAHDRQSPIDMLAVNALEYPLFANARALEAVLHPGDMLYIPTAWIHHVETETLSLSINHWWPLGLEDGGFDPQFLWKTLLFQLASSRYPLRAELRTLAPLLLSQQLRAQLEVGNRLLASASRRVHLMRAAHRARRAVSCSHAPECASVTTDETS